MYESFEKNDGDIYLPNAWSLVFKGLEDKDYWPQSSENELQWDCSYFSRDSEDVLFVSAFVNDQSMIKFLESSSKIYLYGAYNQINVCQMRVKGTVSLKTSDCYENFVKVLLRKKVTQKYQERTSCFDDEKKERLEVIDNGKLFCFYPEEYSYKIYTRG